MKKRKEESSELCTILFFNTLIEEGQGRQVLVNGDECVKPYVRILIRQSPSQGSLLLGFFLGSGSDLLERG